jgi:predicted nucleotidyltransferase
MKATGAARQKCLNAVSYCLTRTDFAPFTWIYRGLARAAIRAAALYLRRGDMIRAIYLIRGFARGKEVFGQSDIDLLVIVKEESHVPTVIARYRTIARICPIFDKTLGIAGFEKMQSLYRDYDVSKYRYNIDSGHWKLLYGEDIRKFFSEPVTGLALDRSLLAELCKIWNNLVQNIANRRIPRFKMNYLIRKFQPETEQILSHSALAGREIVRSKENDVSIHFGMRRIDDYSRTAASTYHGRASGAVPIAASVPEIDLFLSESAQNRIQALQSLVNHSGLKPDRMAVLPRILTPSIRSLLNPRVEVRIERDVLFHLGSDDVCLYLFYENELPAAPLMHWAAASSEAQASQRVDLFITLSCSAFCLSNYGTCWDARPSILNPVTSPIEFFLLLETGTIRPAPGIHYGLCPDEIARHMKSHALEELALLQRYLYSDFAADALVGRYKAFYRLLQLVFLVEGFRESRLDLPLTSRTLARRLREEGSGVSDWVCEFQAVYENLMNNRSVPHATASSLIAKAMDYAQGRCQAFTRGGQS